MRNPAKVLVTGAGGFIGSHLVTYLKETGYWVRGADLKEPEFSVSQADEFILADLRSRDNCRRVTEDIDEVYALAADMGGMGYIASHNATILRDNSLINTLSLDAAHQNGVKRYLLASSACVYPEYRQVEPGLAGLKEEEAFPAQPQDAYGWEKLTAEQLCCYYQEELDLETRIVRLHNIFGPRGTWEGGREKAPAALCRKVAMAKLSGEKRVEIWGDGLQTRSFCYIDDCVEGLHRLMRSDFSDPVNLGQDRLISIDNLLGLITEIAGIEVSVQHIAGPQGVRGRNSDNTLLRTVLGWEPRVSLEEGLQRTYEWIEEQVQGRLNLDQGLSKGDRSKEQVAPSLS